MIPPSAHRVPSGDPERRKLGIHFCLLRPLGRKAPSKQHGAERRASPPKLEKSPSDFSSEGGRGVRAVHGARLEIWFGETQRGFESPPLRFDVLTLSRRRAHDKRNGSAFRAGLTAATPRRAVTPVHSTSCSGDQVSGATLSSTSSLSGDGGFRQKSS